MEVQVIYYFGTKSFADSEVEATRLFYELLLETDAVGIDIESVSLKDTTMVGVGVAPTTEDCFYFTEGEYHHVYNVLANDRITKVFHNCLFDLEELDRLGVERPVIGDTSYMARLLGLPGGLSELVRELHVLGWTDREYVALHMGDVMKEYNVKKTTDMPQAIVAAKCHQDCIATLAAYRAMLPHVTNATLEAYSVDIRMVPILLRLGRRGISLDQDKVEELISIYEQKVGHWRGVSETLGLKNPGSPVQVSSALQKRGVLFPKLYKGKYSVSTGERELKFKEDMLAQLVLQFRADNYFLTHYARPLRGKDRQYSHYHLDAATSRMSSYNMNLMNIPKGPARNCFIPDSGWFTMADGSQMQLRALAFESQDPVMLKIYENDGDIHQETADYFNMKRDSIIKSVNFGMAFGATEETVMDTANVNDWNLANKLILGWQKKYKIAWEWIAYQQEVGVRDGFVFTHFGRKLYVPLDRGKAHARRCAVNFPIQGVEAEIIKRWLIACDDRGLYELANIVHDEGIWDGYIEDLPDLNDFSPFHCPMNVSHVERWG